MAHRICINNWSCLILMKRPVRTLLECFMPGFHDVCIIKGVNVSYSIFILISPGIGRLYANFRYFTGDVCFCAVIFIEYTVPMRLDSHFLCNFDTSSNTNKGVSIKLSLLNKIVLLDRKQIHTWETFVHTHMYTLHI